jgi:ABC-2 type transport system permease protein
MPPLTLKGLNLMIGFLTLLYKEVLRFWRVAFQTVLAPVITSLLYLLIFSHALSQQNSIYPNTSYIAFLVPGLAMMSMLQNAFANTSSSLIQSKVTGNLVFILLAPFSYLQFFAAYTLAAIIRGLAVGIGIILASCVITPIPFTHIFWIVVFGFFCCSGLGILGIIAGIWAEKFDQLAAFQNFVIMPLTFLSGVFYSIHHLPPFWQTLSIYNPIFYMIDGFRYGFLGYSDVSPWLSLYIVAGTVISLAVLTLFLLKSGYKLRH